MPATFGPYWLNAETFTGASGIWTTSALTTCANPGYYSNGVIQRYLTNTGTSCSLGTPLPCPQCALPPDIICGDSPFNASGGQAEMFVATASLGVGTGVALIAMDPWDVPDGMAARYPATTGLIHNEGSSQYQGFAASNYGGASTDLWDNACWVGTVFQMVSPPAWDGLVNNGAVCGGVNATCPGFPVTTAGTYTTNIWDGSAWVNSGLPTTTIEIANYNFGNGGTQMALMGLDSAGVCQTTTAVADCSGGCGFFYIPIVKTTVPPADVDICFVGFSNSNTQYDWEIICPITPYGFAMSALIASEVNAAVTPLCTDGTPGAYPNTLFQTSIWAQVAQGIDPGYVDAISQHSFAWDNVNATGARINEGGVAGYEWYKVNLQTGDANANHILSVSTTGQIAWSNLVTNTSALVQIDTNGIITRIVACNN